MTYLLVDPFDVQYMSDARAAEFPALANPTTLADEFAAAQAVRQNPPNLDGLNVRYSEQLQAWGSDQKLELYERMDPVWRERGRRFDEFEANRKNLGDHYNEFAADVGGFFGRFAGGVAGGAADTLTDIPWGLIALVAVALLLFK